MSHVWNDFSFSRLSSSASIRYSIHVFFRKNSLELYHCLDLQIERRSFNLIFNHDKLSAKNVLIQFSHDDGFTSREVWAPFCSKSSFRGADWGDSGWLKTRSSLNQNSHLNVNLNFFCEIYAQHLLNEIWTSLS